ncbi:DEAD/DEAH box helicase [Halogeometricum borinquense]|uniref:DEAD/DEAH box helicase n=1 Tax=Halogeometricum borinquense TaxID=60847 RepID=UPI003436A8BD
MKPVDKFGDRIHPSVFEILSSYGESLSNIGYSESRTKPNLFYYSPTDGISFFMDMRGTPVIDIRDDQRPLFYWNIDLEMEDWTKRRLLKEERERLAEHGVPLRLSGARLFFSFSDSGPGEEDFLNNPFGPEDGYCESCGRDFSDSGYFCSEDCEREERPDRFCGACEERVDAAETIRHHVSYFPEETVTVCRACHNKIHFSDQYPELTPPEEDIRRFYDEEQEESAGERSPPVAESGIDVPHTPDADEDKREWREIFPYVPRPAQRDGIESTLPVLESDGYVIIEGACGTGKTLMSLTAAVQQIVNGEKERLVAITPLKQQQQQFVEDLRAINQNLLEYEKLNGLALIGKKEVCPYSREGLLDFSPDNVQGKCSDLREETRDSFDESLSVAEQARSIVDDAYVGADSPDPDPDYWPGVETAGSWSRFPQNELPSVDESEVCPFYAQHYAYEKRPPFGFSSAPNHVFSGEDLVRTAVNEDYCPHSAMYALIGRAQVLIANYTHLFHDGVRGLLDDFIDENTLLIVDEAHNLEARVRNNLDQKKALSTIQKSADDLEEILNRPPIKACDLEEEVGAELTKEDLKRARMGLNTFIEEANRSISEYLGSEYGDWEQEIVDLLSSSEGRLDYLEDPDTIRDEFSLPDSEEMPLQPLGGSGQGSADEISAALDEIETKENDLTPLSALAKVADAMEKTIDAHTHHLDTAEGRTILDPYDTATANVDADTDIQSTPLGEAAIQRYQQWVEEDGHYTDDPELSTLGKFMDSWEELDTVSHTRLANVEWDWNLPDAESIEDWQVGSDEAWQSTYRASLRIMNCVPKARIQDELTEFGEVS